MIWLLIVGIDSCLIASMLSFAKTGDVVFQSLAIGLGVARFELEALRK